MEIVHGSLSNQHILVVKPNNKDELVFSIEYRGASMKAMLSKHQVKALRKQLKEFTKD